MKQKGFVKEYVSNGGNATKAAEKVYNVTSTESAQAIGSNNLQKPVVQQEIDKALKEEDVTVKRAMGAISNGLDSDKENIQLRAADMTLKLHNAYPRRSGSDHRQAHLHLHQAQALQYLETLTDEELDEDVAAAKRGMEKEEREQALEEQDKVILS